jgi:hypothetical protein
MSMEVRMDDQFSDDLKQAIEEGFDFLYLGRKGSGSGQRSGRDQLLRS